MLCSISQRTGRDRAPGAPLFVVRLDQTDGISVKGSGPEATQTGTGKGRETGSAPCGRSAVRDKVKLRRRATTLMLLRLMMY
ncbi:MAG: hypothetical protein [Cressdnaviricota sp.]|nr:MAG: hypothetical protein [Cressdnaviricota sp.]